MSGADEALIFLPLGGSGEIGMNLNLYCLDGKWVMLDLGITFGEPDLPGIELDRLTADQPYAGLMHMLMCHGTLTYCTCVATCNT